MAAKDGGQPRIAAWPARFGQQKKGLVHTIVEDVMTSLNYKEDSDSVAFDEIVPEDCAEKVYKLDVISEQNKLHVKLGYTM